MKILILYLALSIWSSAEEIVSFEKIKGEIPLRLEIEKRYPNHKVRFSFNDGDQLFALYSDKNSIEDNVIMIVSPNYVIKKLLIRRNQKEVEEKIKPLSLRVSDQADGLKDNSKSILTYVLGCKFSVKNNERFNFICELERNGKTWKLQAEYTNQSWKGQMTLLK